MTELTIRLTTAEMRQLKQNAYRELRDLDAQAAWMLRQALGFTTPAQKNNTRANVATNQSASVIVKR